MHDVGGPQSDFFKKQLWWKLSEDAQELTLRGRSVKFISGLRFDFYQPLPGTYYNKTTMTSLTHPFSLWTVEASLSILAVTIWDPPGGSYWNTEDSAHQWYRLTQTPLHCLFYSKWDHKSWNEHNVRQVFTGVLNRATWQHFLKDFYIISIYLYRAFSRSSLCSP